jgi:hypothetical protein
MCSSFCSLYFCPPNSLLFFFPFFFVSFNDLFPFFLSVCQVISDVSALFDLLSSRNALRLVFLEICFKVLGYCGFLFVCYCRRYFSSRRSSSSSGSNSSNQINKFGNSLLTTMEDSRSLRWHMSQ